jgi:hypothetical protein
VIDLKLGGLRIIRDINMTDTVEDWSRVRSPSRARRRRKLGHPQNIVWREVPKKDAFKIGDALVMHPETAKALNAMIEKQMEEAFLHGESFNRTTADAGGALTMEHIERFRRFLK